MKVRVSSGKEVDDLYTAAEPSPAQDPGLEPHTQTDIQTFLQLFQHYTNTHAHWLKFQYLFQ